MHRRESTYYNDDDDDRFVDNQVTYRWDLFTDTPRKLESGSSASSKMFDVGEKVMKIIAFILTFSIVLGSAVVSKGTLLFMTSQVAPVQNRSYCNADLGVSKEFKVVELGSTERGAWIWMLLFTYFVPQAQTFLRSLRICFFKQFELPKWSTFFIIFFTETPSAIGNAILVYAILPYLDVIKGAMLMNAFCIVPSVVALLSRNMSEKANMLYITLDVLSIIAQATAFVAWPLVATDENSALLWLIPLAVILISISNWENFVSEESPIKWFQNLQKDNKNKIMGNDRYSAYLFISVWKCLVYFTTMLTTIYFIENDTSFLFSDFNISFSNHTVHITEIPPIIDSQQNDEVFVVGNGVDIETDYNAPIYVFLINAGCSYLCYICGKFACRVMIQQFSFAFPLNLVMPVTISGLVAMCGKFIKDDCAFSGTIPTYLFFNLPDVYTIKEFMGNEFAWIWLLWLLSQIWITIHIWNPAEKKLSCTEKLFYRPLYDAFLFDQDISMNRRRDEIILDEVKKTKGAGLVEEDMECADNTPRVFACGTMWHENKEEMMEFLKSIMRLDEDQCARRLAKKFYDDVKDYYELETHVFFDDAFIRESKDAHPELNEYVTTLVEAVSDSAVEVHGIEDLTLAPPKKMTTPYGGRLIWTLPGGTRMIAHLKDKAKIRPKKRWSQVMYMYYLLGHRLVEQDTWDDSQKDTVADNTYLLALDGDIDFQPKALHLLLDLMKKNRTLGAACGRIHPTGSGPIVWYQKFEYAVGHWLQKATEHVIGCVLCSPGCFSLFRGHALMDDNVMRKYTTRSYEARHYVQYDQGEDRWLCTLLLQRGWRVEYSAASDAFTHAPEGFNEFYNQRRRWMPSTTANIFDLLMDSKRTIENNPNISYLYIFYQIVLMVGTILGPGTIFLMLVGAFVATFGMGQKPAFLWNLFPILLFVLVCKFVKNDKIQLSLALAISAAYGLIMMAVLVGIMLQMQADGLLSPSSLFFFFVAGEFIVAAILHPKEFGCLPYGIIYYVTVPSMYMLLVIYSVFNMNNVSWGTREVTTKKADAVPNAAPSNATKQQNSVLSTLNFFGSQKDNAGGCEIGASGCFKCMCCTHEKQSVEKYQLEQIRRDIEGLNVKMDHLGEQTVQSQPKLSIDSDTIQPVIIKGEAAKPVVTINDDSSSIYDSEVWLEDKCLLKSENTFISLYEERFWNDVLGKYLAPIDDSQDKARITRELADLRDKAVGAFFMLNALFVVTVFLMTLNKEILHFNWPFNVKANFTYSPDLDEVTMVKEYLQLEPIGFVVLIFFASLMMVQFIAMLFHRFATVSQILSNTDVIAEAEMDTVMTVKRLQKLRNANDGNRADDNVERRKTVMNIINQAGNKRKTEYKLEDVFNENLDKLINTVDANNTAVRDDEAALVRRVTQFRRETAYMPEPVDDDGDIFKRRSTVNRRQSSFRMPRQSAFGNPGYEDTEMRRPTAYRRENVNSLMLDSAAEDDINV